MRRLVVVLACCLGLGALAAPVVVERVSTVAPFPRGLVMVNGVLYTLCRGRVRDAGGVSADVDDQAGTIYAINPNVTEPFATEPVGEAVRTNGTVFARPSSPPFKLWDASATPPWRDRITDRPYCTLCWHPESQNLFICAFSGIDKPGRPGDVAFSKNLTDALLRYDLRDRAWHEVERHDMEAGGNYPQHDPRFSPPPHGWLNGPDNCQCIGRWLYGVGKDNNVLVRYDLSAIMRDPAAGPPPSVKVLGERIAIKGQGTQTFYGHSMIAYHDGWFYLGFRTTSNIIRFKLDKEYAPVQPIEAELVAQFDPFDAQTLKSSNLTDMSFDAAGRLYVVSAKPAKVYRFTPDPKHPFDGREGKAKAWLDLAGLTHNPQMKCENVMCAGGYCYVSSGDEYPFQHKAAGAIYRVKISD